MRDPVLLGEALLRLREEHAQAERELHAQRLQRLAPMGVERVVSCSETADACSSTLWEVPDHEDVGPIGRYGRPQDQPEGKYVRWISS